MLVDIDRDMTKKYKFNKKGDFCLRNLHVTDSCILIV